MKRKSLIKIIFFSIILIGILGFTILLKMPRIGSAYGPGMQDFSKNITNGYTLYRISAHQVIVAPIDGWNDEISIIPSKVLKVNNYKDYILAERQGLKRRSPNNSLDTYEIPDENVKDYWILDTKNNWVLKNMTKFQFQRKLDSLKIPHNIELKDIYKY